MIVRSLLFGLGLFVLYSLCLLAPPFRDRFLIQSQWQENVVKAQTYHLAHTERPCVVVGSSLAARLVFTDFQSISYDLSFLGDGPLTGLEIIRRSSAPPALVLIETNMVMREVNSPLIDGTFRPGFSHLRPVLPAIREQYQPGNFLAGKLGDKLLQYSLRWTKNALPTPGRDASGSTGDQNTRSIGDHQFALQKQENEILPAPAPLDRNIRLLREYVSALEKRGCRCVFFEMPIESSLRHLPLPTLIREKLKAEFPTQTWISPDRDYPTVDGVHLSGSQAKIYASYLLATLQRDGLLKPNL
jgi:hypothetical protein